MANPNIQIDDLVREMTDEEYAAFIADEPDYVAATEPVAKTTKTSAK